jgi:transcriptional antiterminator RfaH
MHIPTDHTPDNVQTKGIPAAGSNHRRAGEQETQSSLESVVQPGLAWFCVRSQPKHEHVATANLRRNLELEVVNPRIRFKRPTSRGPIWVTESLFPNYLFARFSWKASLETVRHTGGVAGVVHFGSFWPEIPDATISDLRKMVGEDEVRTIEQTLRVGDEVEVATGAFAGFQGIISRLVPARQRVAVLLEFLGRQSLVELQMETLILNGCRYGSRQLQARALA